MTAFYRMFCFCAAVLIAGAVNAQPAPGAPPRFVESDDPRVQNRTYTFTDTGEAMPYSLFVSSKVLSANPAPLLVVLHGLGIGPGFMMRGNILVHNHCYRADEMAQMIDVAREFGYRIRSFHHGVEAYKVADLLARYSISASIWSDWGGFKMEALDGIRANIPILQAAGARAVAEHASAPGELGVRSGLHQPGPRRRWCQA